MERSPIRLPVITSTLLFCRTSHLRRYIHFEPCLSMHMVTITSPIHFIHIIHCTHSLANYTIFFSRTHCFILFFNLSFILSPLLIADQPGIHYTPVPYIFWSPRLDTSLLYLTSTISHRHSIAFPFTAHYTFNLLLIFLKSSVAHIVLLHSRSLSSKPICRLYGIWLSESFPIFLAMANGQRLISPV